MTLDLAIGVAISLPFGLIASRISPISGAGALAGVACGALVYAAFYLAGFGVLGAALILTIAGSRIAAARGAGGYQHSRRGVPNIIANCGVGTVAAVAELANLGLRTEVTALWFVSAIAAGASDTVASEIGRAFGGAPRAFPTGRLVEPGTPGAVSAVGTIAALAAAAIISWPALALWLLPWNTIFPVLAGTVAGGFVESFLATTLESRGRIGNHALNAINTAVAAVVAVTMGSA